MKRFQAGGAADGEPIELFATDGVRLTGRYWPEPAGRRGTPTLAYVVAHGFTGSSSNRHVQRICARLNGRGAAVLVVDFRGHGTSGGLTSVGVSEQLDVAAAIAHLRGLGHERVCTAGWSMGSSVVIRAVALAHGSDGRADVAVGVSGPGLWYERGTKSMRRLHLGAETASGRWVMRHLLHTRVDVQGWDELPESPVELVHRIAPTPLLLVHGEADPYFPLRHAYALAAAAPTAELWVEPGMGHAEAATSPELVDRIDAWVRRSISPADRPGLPPWTA